MANPFSGICVFSFLLCLVIPQFVISAFPLLTSGWPATSQTGIACYCDYFAGLLCSTLVSQAVLSIDSKVDLNAGVRDNITMAQPVATDEAHVRYGLPTG